MSFAFSWIACEIHRQQGLGSGAGHDEEVRESAHHGRTSSNALGPLLIKALATEADDVEALVAYARFVLETRGEDEAVERVLATPGDDAV